MNKYRLAVQNKKTTSVGGRAVFMLKGGFLHSENPPLVLVNISQHFFVSDIIFVEVGIIHSH